MLMNVAATVANSLACIVNLLTYSLAHWVTC